MSGFDASWLISHIATGSPLAWLTHEYKPQPERATSVGERKSGG